jgi:hypothetical protein
MTRAHLFNSLRCLGFRFFLTAAGSAGVLGCIYITTFAICSLWRNTHAPATELPSWMPLLCIPGGTLIFLAAMHFLGAIDWAERVSKRLKKQKGTPEAFRQSPN